jgi:hypothetical protein
MGFLGMTVIKRDRSSSAKDLLEAIEKFIDLLSAQNEDEAIEALEKALQELKNAQVGSPQHNKAVGTIVDAFDEHELSAYIIEKPNPAEWTEADELSLAATRVLNLAKRLRT